MPTSKNINELSRFIGATAFYARYIPMFSQIVAPLNDLKKRIESINKLKKALINAPVLKYPQFDKPFILQTDGSASGLGPVLLLKHDDELHPIMYCSRKLNPSEISYNSHELEMLAVINALDKLKEFLLDRHFTLQTDCSSLLWLFNTPAKFNKLSRWILKISRFDFTPEHIKGHNNNMADFLYRLYESQDSTNIQDEIVNVTKDIKFVKARTTHSDDPGYAAILNKINKSLEHLNILNIVQHSEQNSNIETNSNYVKNNISLNVLSISNFDFLSIKNEQR